MVRSVPNCHPSFQICPPVFPGCQLATSVRDVWNTPPRLKGAINKSLLKGPLRHKIFARPRIARIVLVLPDVLYVLVNPHRMLKLSNHARHLLVPQFVLQYSPLARQLVLYLPHHHPSEAQDGV